MSNLEPITLQQVTKKFDVIERLRKQHSGDDRFGVNVKFELDRLGSDPADHNGILWVRLLCPSCRSSSKFSPIYGVVERGDVAPGEVQKDYHYICQCEYCGGVVYVKVAEGDVDPDWYCDYESSYPTAEVTKFGEVPKAVVGALNEAARCLNAGAFYATILMCREAVDMVRETKGLTRFDDLRTTSISVCSQSIFAKLLEALLDVGHLGDRVYTSDRAKEVFSATTEFVKGCFE